MLDGSIHVGVKHVDEGSLVKLEALNSSADGGSQAGPNAGNGSALANAVNNATPLSAAQLEELELLRSAVDDLKWKLGYEKGIYAEMVELLEKKAA